jgi:ppGpp synthetase/RelA/SpoT-type nucleotidyltranferase
MRTLQELFEKDFEEHLNITRAVAVRDDSQEMLDIPERVHFDFERAVTFVSYFVPYSTSTLSCCAALLSRPLDAVQQATNSVEIVRRTAFSPDGVQASALSFSREVIFYIENLLDEEELQALTELAQELQFTIYVRGPEYCEMRAKLPKLIDKFMNDYRRSCDYYFAVARLVAGQLEERLKEQGIRGWVTFRSKRPDSLASKIERRALTLGAGKDYRTVDDIYADIADLAGVRVALYFPEDRIHLRKIVHDLFEVLFEREMQGTATMSEQKRFSGYWGTHYRVSLRAESLSASDQRYQSARVEIQVASIIMHAWAEVEHDLIYKPYQGSLSPEEYAILDELNGIVLSGERVLERLHKAGQQRKEQIAAWHKRIGSSTKL